MPRFFAKPVEVVAIQWAGDKSALAEFNLPATWFTFDYPPGAANDESRMTLYLLNLSGGAICAHADEGAWIVQVGPRSFEKVAADEFPARYSEAACPAHP